MNEDFKRWLDRKVERHKREIFIHYSNMLMRWESQWWTEKMARKQEGAMKEKGEKQ